MSILTNVSVGIYLKGSLLRAYMVGTLTEACADALDLQLQRDYPGCEICVTE